MKYPDKKDLLCLMIVLGCVQHYSGHVCIALAAVSALIYLKGAR